MDDDYTNKKPYDAWKLEIDGQDVCWLCLDPDPDVNKMQYGFFDCFLALPKDKQLSVLESYMTTLLGDIRSFEDVRIVKRFNLQNLETGEWMEPDKGMLLASLWMAKYLISEIEGNKNRHEEATAFVEKIKNELRTKKRSNG